MMKRAWAAQLEVLKAVDDICEQMGIKYYAAWGTLLGAVRHKGFIPWDDDIDIYMLGNDYQRFVNEAHRFLPEGLVLSGMYAKAERFWNCCNAHTRVITDEEYYTLPKMMSSFHAYPYPRVGIDIFPLYYLPADPEERYNAAILCDNIQSIMDQRNEIASEGSLYDKVSVFFDDIQTDISYYESDEDLLRRVRIALDQKMYAIERDSGMLTGDVYYNLKRIESDHKSYRVYNGIDAEYFNDTISIPFENILISVPLEYDKVLKVSFGEDYMVPQMKPSSHEYPFYRIQEASLIKLLKESGISSTVDEFCDNWHAMIGFS